MISGACVHLQVGFELPADRGGRDIKLKTLFSRSAAFNIDPFILQQDREFFITQELMAVLCPDEVLKSFFDCGGRYVRTVVRIHGSCKEGSHG